VRMVWRRFETDARRAAHDAPKYKIKRAAVD
jgi:hypothetical protein